MTLVNQPHGLSHENDSGLAVPAPLGAICLLAAVSIAAHVGLGSVTRHLYLVIAFGLGALMARRKPVQYCLFVVCLFVFTPLARRVIDLGAGYQEQNLTMLAPYAVACLAFPHCCAFVLSGKRLAFEALILMLVIAWGLAAAISGQQVTDILLSALRWFSPILLFGYVQYHHQEFHDTKGIVSVLAIVSIVASIYALVQYVFPPVWDVYWVQNAPIGTGPLSIVGTPEPFGLRVFGTMNSPGSLATAIATIAVIVFTSKSRLIYITTLLAFAAIALTLQRSVAGGLVISAGLLFIFGNATIRLRLLGLVLAAIAAGLAASSLEIAELGSIFERFNFSDGLEDDGSLAARMSQLENFGNWLSAKMMGYGLGFRDTLTTYNGSLPFVLDNGLIELFLTFGVVFGMAYLIALVSLLFSAGRAGARRGGLALGCFCAAAGIVVQLPLGAVVKGEHGVFAFLMLALATLPSEEGKNAT